MFPNMKLSEARNQRGLTQEQISRTVNVSLKHYQNIEHGLTSPTVNIALHICEILNVDPREIDEWKDRRKEDKF
ncbi:MAG: transcriptional regulator [Paenibacillaceae bacterium]|nr:transcriptional regulator [Paenibacillaceae bacterium]